MIAVAISIGVLVTTWVTNWTQRQTSSDTACAINTNYVINSVEWNKTGYNSTLLVKITNKGSQKLYGFGAVIDNGTKINEFDYTVIDQGGVSSLNKLDRERSVYLLINLTNSTLRYPAFGRSLTKSDDIEIRITNKACDAVSATIDSVS